MELTNKAAYIKGLIDGMKIDDSTDQGRVLKAMAELLSEMAGDLEAVSEEVSETVELVDILDRDLSDVEAVLFGDEEDADFYDDEDYDDEDFEEVTTYECECPSCGDRIRLDESILADGSIDCPNCGEKLEFDFSEVEEPLEDDDSDN